ncbi:MAG: LysM peptidoglycan-binding domain-containing protein [Chloroflexota bacterium]
MARMKRGILIASILMLASVVLSACNQPYSQAPAVTNTPIAANNLFASAQPTDMGAVQALATGSAIAQMTTSPGAPAAATATLAPGITPPAVTPTNTPLVSLPATATLAVPNVPTATSQVQSGPRPASYTLQDGEYPYCIARRFNVDPQELLTLNGITDSPTLYAGKALAIPQTGNPFPGNRMWHNHPDTYTVDSSSETIYGVACYYGDIDPSRIAQANNLSLNSSLTAGQKLQIP